MMEYYFGGRYQLIVFNFCIRDLINKTSFDYKNCM